MIGARQTPKRGAFRFFIGALCLVALLGALACTAEEQEEPTEVQAAASEPAEPASGSALSEMDELATFPILLPPAALGAGGTECLPGDDPYSACI